MEEGTVRQPERAPTIGLGVNRFALVDGDATFDTNLSSNAGPHPIFTLEDTAGCSCEQISPAAPRRAEEAVAAPGAADP